MNELILSKMRAGDWGEVVRLMREEYGPTLDPERRAERSAMPFRERFDTVRVTPQKVAESVVEDNGRFSGIMFEGERYKPSRRFLKGLAQRMKVSLSVFELFSPLEVVRRAAERAPDLPLRLTLDRQDHQALGLIEDKGVPIRRRVMPGRVVRPPTGARRPPPDASLRTPAGSCGQSVRQVRRDRPRRDWRAAARLRECLASPLRSSKNEDFAFFRLMLR